MAAAERVRRRTIDSFWETVPPLWGMIRSHLRASATADYGITVEQFHILRYVRRGTQSMSELATARNISRPAISQAVESLVRKGLLTRTHSTGDRRCVELALTGAGSALLEAMFGQTRAWMSERMRSMTETELGTIAKAMEALKKMLA
jgi:DNA-binding MarR family transcriptional regulator